MKKGLCGGRVVSYVLGPDDVPGTHQRCVGQVIPAIVVNDWRHLNRDDGYANLTGFPDWTNQGLPAGIVWLTSRVYSADRLPGTWHWPDGSPAALEAAQLPPPEPVAAVETAVSTETTGRSVSVSKDDGMPTDTVSEVSPVRETEEFCPSDIGDMPPDLMPDESTRGVPAALDADTPHLSPPPSEAETDESIKAANEPLPL